MVWGRAGFFWGGEKVQGHKVIGQKDPLSLT